MKRKAHTASLRGKPAIPCKKKGIPAFAGMTALGVREANSPSFGGGWGEVKLRNVLKN